MNTFTKLYRTHKQRKAYRKYINEHKKNILRAYYEMLQCKDLEWIMRDKQIMEALWFRALEHDDSKFEEEEFEPYRKEYFPINLEEKYANKNAYEWAKTHHLQTNDHHWQYRAFWDDADFDINTELACLENIMDWLAIGYKYHNRPYEYYELHKDEIKLPKKQIEFIEKCIYQGIDKKYLVEDNDKIVIK